MSSTIASNTVASSASIKTESSSKSSDKSSSTDVLQSVFNQSNILILLWFLAIYVIIYPFCYGQFLRP